MIELSISFENYVNMNDKNKEYLKSNFNWDKEDRLWISNNEYKETLEYIENHKNIINNYSSLKEKLNIIYNKYKIKNKDLEDYSYLYDFQKKIIIETLKLYEEGYRGCNYFMEVGIGKSITSLVSAEIINNNINNQHIIILCPSVLKTQWKEEIDNFKLKGNSIIIEGSPNKRNEQWNADVTYKISTYESFIIDYNKGYINDFNIFILDECLIIKNPNTKVHKTIQEIGRRVKFIFNLTGTPYSNTLKDVFGINYIIDKNNYKNIIQFNSHHAVYNEIWNGREKIIIISGYKDEDIFFNKIKKHTFLLKKKDVKSDLPEITIYTRYFKISPEQKKLLKYLKSYLDEEESIFTIFMLLKMLDCSPKLLMSSSSEKILEYENKEEIKEIGEKVERLKEEIEQIGNNQVLIFTEFINMANFINEELNKNGLNCNVITGNTNQKNKDEIIEKFKKNTLQILVATDCLSQGISFPNVDYLINFDLPVTVGEMEQRKGRILRINSKENKVIINFIGSIIGWRIKNILENKMEFANEMEKIKYIVSK